MPRFLQPTTWEEAWKLLSTDEDIRILAGGTDLLVLLRLGAVCPDALMDSKKLPGLLEFGVQDGVLRIGAAVTCNEIASSPMLVGTHEVLAQAAGNLANSLLRNRATLVGNLCNASPGADMAGACLVLGATLVIASPTGQRCLPVKDFFLGVKRNALNPGEIVVRLEVPLLDGRGFYLKKRRIHGHDLAQVGVSAAYSDAGRLTLALGAVATTPLLLDSFGVLGLEELIARREEIAQAAMEAAQPISDVRASAAYRTAMVGYFTRRIIDALIVGREKADV